MGTIHHHEKHSSVRAKRDETSACVKPRARSAGNVLSRFSAFCNAAAISPAITEKSSRATSSNGASVSYGSLLCRCVRNALR